MSSTEPFSPLPDEQPQDIPGPDARAGAPDASSSIGVGSSEDEENREATDGDENAGQPKGGAAGGDLDSVLEGREDPPFRTPQP